MTDVVDALRARVRSSGPQPLVTYYDLGSGERTELSAVTFANWVDKSCHYFDELGLGPGAQLAVPVLDERPGHWIALVAVMAGWQLGAHVVVQPTPDTVVAVVGPDHPWVAHPPTWLTVVACSLHPLGLPLHPQPPVLDFAEVLSYPDASSRQPHLATDPAWEDLAYGDLAAVTPEARRILLRAHDHEVVLPGLVAPLLGGGSAVLVNGRTAPATGGGGDEPERWQRLATDERAVTA